MVDIIPKVKDKTGRDFVVRLLSDANHAVIDRQGIVRWKLAEADYNLRPTNEKVLEGPRPDWP